MKLVTAEQLRAIDAYTIAHEPIASIDLMERAASACMRRIVRLTGHDDEIFIACGKGNNGGDGLAIARLLLENGFNCRALVIHYSERFSADAQQNYDRLKERFAEHVHDCYSPEQVEEHKPGNAALLVDALLGTGISKPADGFLGDVIDMLNRSFRRIISIDVPSGLYTDKTSKDSRHIICSTLTLTFQLPKLAFLMPENKLFVPEFEIIDIGLHAEALQNAGSNYYYITAQLVASFLKPRQKFSHKGSFGHALLAAGSKGKSGAAIISALSCMRSGAGLLTLHSNKETINALLHHLPEAMSSEDAHPEFISRIDKPERFDAIAFGPGVGLHEETQQVLKNLLGHNNGRLVIDADGLNSLSENKTWLGFLPSDTILTPHPKEFERLTEACSDDFERLDVLKRFSSRCNCIVILKGAHSAVAMPDGSVFFNSSGNPGLAKAGSGDGLTGIILGLLSRGYNAPQSALIGTFVHGYAADLCLKKISMESLLITDVIKKLPTAFKKLYRES